MGRKDKRIPLDNVDILQVGAKMRMARQLKDITLTDLALKLGYTKSHLSSVENGVSRPSLDLVQKYEQALELEPDELRQLFDGIEANQQYSVGFPRTHQVLESAVNQDEDDDDLDEDQEQFQETLARNSASYSSVSFSESVLYAAPRVELFCGRDKEIAVLEKWMINDHTPLVLIYGLGGIGKTTLTAEAFHQQKQHFNAFAWFSLQDAPPLEETLVRCIRYVFADEHTKLPTDVEGLIKQFVNYLRVNRCLVVFDNFESVLPESKNVDWHIQKKYENYWKLLKTLVATEHKSCVLLTSREKLRGFASLEAKVSTVHSLQLMGVEVEDVREMLEGKQLSGAEDDWNHLIQKYSGNPLALKLVADPINELFNGDIATFLQAGEGVAVFDDLYELLEEQFKRLSESEREVMYWMTISLEPVSLDDLQDNLVSSPSNRELLETFNALLRRSMVQSSGIARFELQPVIREYITDRLVNEAYSEILSSEELNVIGRYALIQARAKEYIRQNQVRLFLLPLAKRLQTTPSRRVYKAKLNDILNDLRKAPSQQFKYAAGNILNLLIALEETEETIREYDFSHIHIEQAFLQGVSLPDLNFTSATFEKSIFTDTFGSILSLAMNKNGKLLAAGTMNCEVRLWQVPDGVLSVTCQGHTDWIRTVAFSPDGRLVASGSEDTTLRLWDVYTGQCLRTLPAHTSRVYSVAFSPDGKLLASGGEDCDVLLWDTQTWQPRALQGHIRSVRTVAFSPDGKLLASGSRDETIRVWNVQTGECIDTLSANDKGVRDLAFSPDGTRLVSGGNDAKILLWEVLHLDRDPKVVGVHRDRIYSVAFSPDSACIVSGSEDRTARLWRIGTSGSFQTLESHTDRVRSVLFTPDGEKVVSGSEDHTVRFWDVSEGLCVKKLQGYSSWIHSVIFNHKGTMLAVGGEDGQVRLWKGTAQSTALYRTLQGHEGRIRSVAFSPNDSLLASGSEDRTIRLWDTDTGQWLKTFSGHGDRVWSVDFHPLGRKIASGSEDRTIRLWDVRTGEELKQWDAHRARIRSVAFHPDGTMLASASEDQTIRFWDVETALCLKTLPLPEGSKNVWSIAFSPDGRLLASGSEDGVIRIWAAQSGELVQEIPAHEGRVWSVAFNPASTLVVSGGEDRTAGVWDVSSGESLALFTEHRNRVRSVCFQPYTQSQTHDRIASGSHDGTVKLWSFPMDSPPTTLRSDRPYERMNITNAQGINIAQRTILRTLGAIEDMQGGNIA